MGAPTRFFRTPPRSPNAAAPIGFGLVSYTVGQVAYALFVVVVFVAIMSFARFKSAGQFDPELWALAVGIGTVFTALVLMAPIQAFIGIVVSAACAHGTLALMRSTKGGFARTLHAMCYANAPHILFAVPCVGPMLTFTWVPWLEAVGLREAHGVSTGRAVVAAFGWRVAFVLAILAAYALFLALALSTHGSHAAPPG